MENYLGKVLSGLVNVMLCCLEIICIRSTMPAKITWGLVPTISAFSAFQNVVSLGKYHTSHRKNLYTPFCSKLTLLSGEKRVAEISCLFSRNFCSDFMSFFVGNIVSSCCNWFYWPWVFCCCKLLVCFLFGYGTRVCVEVFSTFVIGSYLKGDLNFKVISDFT